MNRKIIISLLIAVLIALSFAKVSYASQPYNSYTYNYWGDAVPAPQAYLPSKVVDAEALGLDNFKEPMDLFVDDNNLLYVADTGNNRIVVVNERWELVRVINEFDNNGHIDTFKGPRGLFVTDEGHVYVADTENFRIVELDADGAFIREIGPPESDVIPADMVYKPAKIALDKANRIYVVALSVNQGIIELDADGNFTGFMGANKVIPNMVELFWKTIATRQQREAAILFVPTEYNNITIDEEGFLYTTTSALDMWEVIASVDNRSRDDKAAMIRKLNPTGTDVLRRYGFHPPVGDVAIPVSGPMYGPSNINDIAVGDYGIYTVLDRSRGRVFTYDSDGNLMYIFGGMGNKIGNFRNPSSIEIFNDQIIVLDSTLNNITVFSATEYGALLNKAVKLHYTGKYEDAAKTWETLLKHNVNLDLAYIGLGRALLRQDRYEEAMEMFRLGDKRDYYSRAFELHRKEVVQDVFDIILIVVILFITAAAVARRRKRRFSRKEVEV